MCEQSETDHADHWPTSVAIPGADRARLRRIRDALQSRLEHHRHAERTDSGYHDRLNLGYDQGLDLAVAILDHALLEMTA